ncbi:uncharacterized protein LOC123532190 [Mercenaria mercenaria]|uniref:uncharacterized protein LOC123532190 n=1 Tax=Mercenaria mercenaria TaxID=6596 RepID=UPI00234E91D6|nr:uncharacterized protein LOC123532190 [Mercenaria mercenaria]
MNSRQPITSISSANFQQKGTGINVNRNYSRDSGLNLSAHRGDVRMSRLDAAEPEAIEYLPQSSGLGQGSFDYTNLYCTIDAQENSYSTIDFVTPPDGDGVPTSHSYRAGCGIRNVYFTIFKRVLSALLIIGDVLLDWTLLSDEITGILSDEITLSLNEKFTFSFPTFDDAVRVFDDSAMGTDNCFSTQTAIWYSGFVLFGSVFAIVKLLNIVGETRREICEKNQKHNKHDESQENEKKKHETFGFQLLHGWVETIFALLFEDLPQNMLLYKYSSTCKGNSLSITKTSVSMIGSLVKNVFRKCTCKQKPGCACCLIAFDIGCMNFSCLSCVVCSCCSAANNYYPDGSLVKMNGGKLAIENVEDTCLCCKCVELEWGCEVGIPPVCSCGSCVFIKQMGCCDNTFKSKCCESNCYCSKGCCGKRIDKDPIWLDKYITLGYLVNVAVFAFYFLFVHLS